MNYERRLKRSFPSSQSVYPNQRFYLPFISLIWLCSITLARLGVGQTHPWSIGPRKNRELELWQRHKWSEFITVWRLWPEICHGWFAIFSSNDGSSMEAGQAPGVPASIDDLLLDITSRNWYICDWEYSLHGPVVFFFFILVHSEERNGKAYFSFENCSLSSLSHGMNHICL